MFRNWFCLIIILVSLIECKNDNAKSSKKNDYKGIICIYTLDSLIKNYDTSKFIYKASNDEIQLVEPRNKFGEAGYYTFYGNKRLRRYLFLSNDSNIVTFSVYYDSLGNEIREKRSEVVTSYFRRVAPDSIEITIFLYSVNHIYSNLVAKINNQKKDIGELFYSNHLSNLVVKSFIMPYRKNKKDDYLYIDGVQFDICKNERNAFIDSVPMPIIPEFHKE